MTASLAANSAIPAGAKKAEDEAGPRTLYIKKPLKNADAIREWAKAQADGKPPETAAAEDPANNPGRMIERKSGGAGSQGGRMRSTAPLQNQRIDGFGAKREAQERFGRVDGRADVRPNGLAVLKDRRG